MLVNFLLNKLYPTPWIHLVRVGARVSTHFAFLSRFIVMKSEHAKHCILMGEIENSSRPGKRLALFFDGTWNEPADHTNVRRLRLMLADRGTDGVLQESFYDEGVGTRWYDRLSGGAFGAGLSDNVRSGYRWLIERYDRGDEIFVFGFSRGAFTARSLAGLVAR